MGFEDTERVTVTAALPYIQGMPHLGNAVGSVLPADIFHRYLDLKGVKNVFICGSDVHGTPLELEAIQRGEDVRELKDKQHEKVKEAYQSLDMDFSIFGETHSEYNRKQTYKMFEELYCNGYINKRTQRMPFCKDDERFLPDRYIEGECPHCGGLARGDQCDDCGRLVEPEELENIECQICGGDNIEFKDTEHLALNLEPFKDQLREWLEEREPVPENMIDQVRHDIENAEERTITRDQEWGFDIPIERVNKRIEEENLNIEKLDPEVFEDKSVYVWFDAPTAYISFTRELFNDGEEWKKHWSGDNTKVYYSIGKDNTIFHTVIWPSMLLGASNEEISYNLPYYEFIQQYMMWNDQAFSTSRGIGIWIDEATDMYPSDYWRFYLSKHMPLTQDTNFTWRDFEAEINNVLNDTVGNFVNRTLALTEKWFDNTVPVGELTEDDEETIREAERIVEDYEKSFENHNLREALEKALELARLGDHYLSEEEPWNNEDRREETIHTAVQIVRGLGVLLYPFTPEASHKIEEMLNTKIHTDEGYNEFFDPLLGGLEPGHELGEREVLFDKIEVEDKKEDKEVENEDSVKMTNQISFEDFQEMDLRIGKVLEVEEHPDADRLYVVKLDVGDQELQTCAGLVNHYEKEELEGRKVVVLANLEPSKLRGETSECMMLAAEDEDGNVSLLQSADEMEEGSEVR